MKNRTVSYEPADLLTYLIDGCTLSYPIVKARSVRRYKTPHWIPTVLRPIERTRGAR